MKFIERHYTKYADEYESEHEYLDESLTKINDEAIADFESKNPQFCLVSYMVCSLNDFNEYQLVPDSEKDYSKMRELLSYCLKFALSYYNRAYHPDEPVKVQFGERIVEKQGFHTSSYMDYRSWLDFFYLYIVCRNRFGIELFLKTDRARLDDSNIISTPEPDYCMVEFMQSMFDESKDTVAAWQKLWDAIGYFSKNHEPDEYLIAERMVELDASLLLLYRCLISGNQSEFTEQLIDCLDTHKRYYEREEEYWFNDHKGWISWRLLACCSIAYDSGLKIEVKSDYLPEWLYKGEVKDWGILLK
jgi:hypothetical protein